MTVQEPDMFWNEPRRYWANRINASWRESVESIIATGRNLLEARSDPEMEGQFQAMIESDLVFGSRTGQRLIAIASNQWISDATHASHLPPSWYTLYELTRLGNETLDRLVRDGIIRADVERAEIMPYVHEKKRQQRLHTIAAEVPEGQFPIILADPPWRYDFSLTRSRQIENQYPTMTLEEICEEPIPEKSTDNAILYLWSTVAKLEQSFDVIEAWGFQYKSNFVWAKGKLGMGYHARGEHEHLLIGTKGDLPPPAPQTREPSIIQAKRTKHSAKPIAVYSMIERFYPELPKLEWFARGAARPGWAAYGNQLQ